jgi:hypothetical protein
MAELEPKSSRGVSKSFLDRADSAAFYEAWVGAVLARAGLYTLHHPFVADGGDYHGQSWDLEAYNVTPEEYYWCTSPPSCRRVEVECKSLSLTFYNTDTYPFDDVLVCSQNSWLRKWPGKDTTQRDFLLISRPTGSVLWLPVSSPVVLGVEVTDRTRGETYKAVQAQKTSLKDLADFVEMVRG